MNMMDQVKAELGKKFNPDAEYLIETHRGAASRVGAGTHREVGKVQDSSHNEGGTMIVLEPVTEKPRKWGKK